MELPGRPSMRDTKTAQADSCGPMPNPVTERAAYLRWQECKAGEGTGSDVDADRKYPKG